jgi:hypothetical protein
MSLAALITVIDRRGIPADEFADWHEQEHVGKICAIPGVLGARRWRMADDTPFAIAFFDLHDHDVLKSDAYRALSGANLTPWSRRIIGRTPFFIRYDGPQAMPGDRMSPADAGALLITAIDPKPEIREEFARWYMEEHTPRLSTVPGVIAARRFVCENSPHQSVATYHLASPDVIVSPAWFEAGETPWTHHVRKFYRDRFRIVCVPDGPQS